MSWLKEVMLTVLVGLSPIWAALCIGAICWAARFFGGATGRTEERRILRSAQNDRKEKAASDAGTSETAGEPMERRTAECRPYGYSDDNTKRR